MRLKACQKIIFSSLLLLIPFFSFSQATENFFWDKASSFSEKNSYFPSAVYNDDVAYVFYENVDKARQEIKISWKYKKGKLDWSDSFSLKDAFKYSGDDIPDIYSAAISRDGEVAVSVLDASQANGFIKVYSSNDSTLTFSEFTFPQQEKQITSSRIFASRNGGFILFISLGEGKQSPTESSFSILYSESRNGKSWSDLKVFTPSATISNAFSPFFTQIEGVDYVFFEGWAGNDSTTSLIYAASRTAASGNSWSEPFLVTDENSMSESGKSYLDYKNFRPYVLSDGINTKIVWERSERNSETACVMASPISAQGRILDRSDVEVLNSFGNGRRPSLFLYNQKFFALWFDDRSGINKIHIAEYLGAQWKENTAFSRRINEKEPCSFPSAFILPQTSSFTLVWQQNHGENDSLFLLSEDYHVDKAKFVGRNFLAGRHSKEKNPSVKIIYPDDISGISGYVGVFTSDKNLPLEKSILSENYHPASDKIINGELDEDDENDKSLYFKVALLDNAGNWSDEAVLEYYYDVTPPEKVTDLLLETDEWGFASSNDPVFTWNKENDKQDDIAGYSWSLTKIDSLEKRFNVSKTKKLTISPEESREVLSKLKEENTEKLHKAKNPPEKIMGEKPEVSFKNKDNGIYAFSVRAIDAAGNAGEVSTNFIFLNKYKAAAQIKDVKASTDDYGNVSLSISGEELSYDGEITAVILTKKENGEKIVLEAESDFTIKKSSDNSEVISDIKLPDIRPGTYSVQIKHSQLGTSTWKKNLIVTEKGTVKYEKQYNFEPIWKMLPFSSASYKIASEKILFWILMILILIGMLVCTRSILVTAQDALKIKKDVSAILKGEYMAMDNLEKMEEKLKVQVSLRLKFGLAITSLLLLIVAGVALAIGYQMSQTQEKILISGLKDRVKTVMGNMSSGVQSYLDDGRDKIVEIGAIVNQTDNFLEAGYATILSYEIGGNELSGGERPLDYVWATNDSHINKKINAQVFDAGTVRYLIDDPQYVSRCKKLNEGAKLIVDDLSNTTGNNSNLIFRKLNEYSASQYGSYPEMSDEKLDRDTTEYHFYWPVIYQKGQNSQTFLQSMILMEVSTDTLVKQVEDSRKLVMSITLAAAVVAAIIALISAFALSSIIVSPIRRIVTHVKKITETENKLLLENVEIKITSHDELRTLGDSVNEMTKGLVKGAKDEERAKIAYQRAAKEREKAAHAQAEEARARAEAAEMNIMNLDGQAVQKAFIPLVSEGSEKETVAELKEKDIQVYGYYEGTDAVSGDYFDYKKLDDRWYSFIKCDASGHGVPAALIMTIVATIFRRYFHNWKFEKNGVKLNLLAADINDFIESLGLRGKFAAMMICLLDTKTGDVYTCNAGDNILRIFDSEEKKIKVITLHEAPAAGPLPSFMVEMKGGYKVEKIKLKKNDVLFLYTDGIEESTRFFRDSNYNVVACDEPSLKEGEVHFTHKKGEVSEQMEPQRVLDVIEAVLNRQKYVLTRYHSPVAGEKLEFDFTKCEGTIEESIIALTAVEKVFRMYKKPSSTGKVEKTEMELDGKRKTVIQISGDGIKIDRKIDAFLKKYFNLYDYYCVNRVDEDETNYVYYTGVSEDVQADDLTLLAIKRM